MSAREAALAVAAAAYLFFELRTLLHGRWRRFLALRLTVALTMLAAAVAAWLFALHDQPWIALAVFGLAYAIGQVGGRAIEQALEEDEVPATTVGPGEAVAKALAAAVFFAVAVADILAD